MEESVSRRLPRVAVLTCLLASLASGRCAAHGPVPLGPAERAAVLAGRGIDPGRIPDVIAASPSMAETAAAVAGAGSAEQRLRALQRWLFDEREFAFDYEDRTTLTAGEAFARRRGNCVSFTNLFIALARSLELPVRAALASGAEGSERIGDLELIDEHVVAVLDEGSRRTVFDFERSRDAPPVGLRVVDDLGLTAIYLNNRGVERLVAGEAAAAAEQLELAVRLAPRFVEAYGNLAVARRRLGQRDAALDANLLALTLDRRNGAIRRNLWVLFGATTPASTGADGAVTAALQRGDAALGRGALRAALQAYRGAARSAPRDAGPHLALARALLYGSRIRAARKELDLALRLEPDLVAARWLLDGIERAAAARG